MSEAGWGTDKPTVAGWYWWRSLLGDVEVVKIGYVGKVARVYGHGSDGLRLEHQGPGEWIGPITPDAYDAGRRDAPIYVCQRCGRLGRDGWIATYYESVFDGPLRGMKCPTCDCPDLEKNTAKELAALCTRLQAALTPAAGGGGHE